MKQKNKTIARKVSTLVLMAILALVLAACAGSDPEPTAVPDVEPEPTEMPPTEEPPAEAPAVEENASPLDAMAHSVDPNLVNKTWVWESRDPNGSSSEAIEIPYPQDYTLFFNEDGTFAAKMDCNTGLGEYATAGLEFDQHSIFMQLGPMTMVACEESSFAPQMGQMFGPAQSYEYEEDGKVVKFIWAAGGPTDYYRSVSDVELPDAEEGGVVGVVTAPDGVYLRSGPGTNYPYVGAAPFEEEGTIIGVSKDGLWWLASAPNLPEGEVWVTAEWVEVTGGENVPVVAAPPLEPTLTNIPWEWVSTTDPAQGTVAVNDPSRYIILFNEDGTAFIQADCNSVQAAYTTDGGHINITPGPSTMAACPPDSLDSQFLARLSAAVIYFIEGGNLYLDLPADSGTMRFVPQGTPPPNPDAPAEEGDGQTFYLISYGVPGEEQALIAGTQITASFADDLVTGSAGCNNYSGQLTPADDHFTVGPVITTQMYCGEPAGVMEQEQSYLTALEATGGFTWEQTRAPDGSLVTEGQLFYFLPSGAAGVLNFSTSPQ